jgi:hypothetical protein
MSWPFSSCSCCFFSSALQRLTSSSSVLLSKLWKEAWWEQPSHSNDVAA